MINDEVDKIIKQFFKSFKKRYQNNSESIKDSEFVFKYFYLFCHKNHNMNQNCGGSHIDSSDWIQQNKQTNKQSKNNNNKFYQYKI